MEFLCSWYSRCPLCYKCMNVAEHLYRRCKRCGFSQDRCNHRDKQKNKMILRKNFKLTLTEETKDWIRKTNEKNQQS